MYEPMPPPGGAAVAIVARYSWTAFALGLCRPRAAINGQPVPVGWGRTVIFVQPGTHHVQVYVPYLVPRRVGVAETMVPAYPGQVVEVEYRAPAFGWLGGAIGPAPQKFPGLPAAITLMATALVMMLCSFGLLGISVLTAASSTGASEPIPRQTIPAESPTNKTTESPTNGPTESAAPQGTKPALRSDAAPRTVVGPSYTAGDKTYTMDITGLPFAFRTPATWSCLPGKGDIPADAEAWVCLDSDNPFGSERHTPDRGKRLQFIVRPCPGGCGKATRATLDKEWLETSDTRSKDGTTYAETARDAKGRYTLAVSRYPGGKYQLVAFVYSQPETKGVVQKIVNDMVTQAG
jgi:hypothetical protein